MSRPRELSGGEKDVLTAELVHQRDGGQPLGLELDAMWEHLVSARPTLFVEVLAGTGRLRAVLARLCATAGYRCYALSGQGPVELDPDRLTTVALMDEFGCQDVLLTAGELPRP